MWYMSAMGIMWDMVVVGCWFCRSFLLMDITPSGRYYVVEANRSRYDMGVVIVIGGSVLFVVVSDFILPEFCGSLGVLEFPFEPADCKFVVVDGLVFLGDYVANLVRGKDVSDE